MPSVTISDEQRGQILSAGGPVELVDPAGEPVGRLTRYTKVGDHDFEGEWPPAPFRGDQSERTHTTAEVMAMLRKISEATA